MVVAQSTIISGRKVRGGPGRTKITGHAHASRHTSAAAAATSCRAACAARPAAAEAGAGFGAGGNGGCSSSGMLQRFWGARGGALEWAVQSGSSGTGRRAHSAPRPFLSALTTRVLPVHPPT